MTKDVLRNDLGISAFGHRIRIFNAITALTAGAPPLSVPTVITASPLSRKTTQECVKSAAAPGISNIVDLVVLHSAPLVIKDSKGRIYPMEKLDLAAERRAIINSLVNEVRHQAIHIRFDVATADILRSLMTGWKCKVNDDERQNVAT